MEIINDLRAAVTVASFLAFLGIVWFAYRRRARAGFDEAADLPFADDEIARRTVAPATNTNQRGHS